MGTSTKEEIMFSSVWFAVILGVTTLGFFVFSLFRRERRLQDIEQRITANQERFTNK